jgi:DNA-binding IclR family transcriptional regulator
MKRKKAASPARGERSGTQTIERAVALLREISARGDFGWQLSDLAARCKLGKSTTHRMLSCLVKERLVRQRASDRHYMPGPMLFELGLSVPGFSDLQHKARGPLATLARTSGGVSFLFFRSGDDFVCAGRGGTTDLKVFSGFLGSRRPLITSAGGFAILLALPPAEAQAIIRRNLRSLPGANQARLKTMQAILTRARAEGLAINVGEILPGINSFGLPVFDAEGQPFASIALAASQQVLPVSRLPDIRKWLHATVDALRAEPT